MIGITEPLMLDKMQVRKRRPLRHEIAIAGRDRNVVQAARQQTQPIARRTHVGVDKGQNLDVLAAGSRWPPAGCEPSGRCVVESPATTSRDGMPGYCCITRRMVCAAGSSLAFDDKDNLVVALVLLEQRPQVGFQVDVVTLCRARTAQTWLRSVGAWPVLRRGCGRSGDVQTPAT